jgi:hypothetical protein
MKRQTQKPRMPAAPSFINHASCGPRRGARASRIAARDVEGILHSFQSGGRLRQSARTDARRPRLRNLGSPDDPRPASERNMRASAIEFRLRMIIQIVIVFFGFWAPWIASSTGGWGFGWQTDTSLVWLPSEAGPHGPGRLRRGHPRPSSFWARVAALAGAVLARVGRGLPRIQPRFTTATCRPARSWPTDPYRYLRNPLYLGGWFMMLAVYAAHAAFSGALFTVVLLTIFYSAPESGRRSVPRRATRPALRGVLCAPCRG